MALQRCSFSSAQEKAEPVQKGTQEALLSLFLDELFIVGSLVGGDDLFREFVRHVREVRELPGVGGAAFCF
jgi:hypothetical protein